MAIVAKKKARGGRGGVCAGVSPRTGALALVAALCVGAAAWWLWAGRARGKEQLRGAEPAKQDVEQGTGNGERGTEEKGEERENVEVWKQPTANVEKGERGTGNGERQERERGTGDGGRGTAGKGTGNGEQAEEEETQEVGEKPKKHFRHPSEQLLAMMLSTPSTSSMPPLPMLDPDDEHLNADAIAAITNALVIYEDDGPETERLKEAVADLKAQLAEAVANGGSVADVLNEFRDWQNEGVEIRNETISAIRAIEDDEEAVDTFVRANEELARESIPPILPEEVGMEEEGREEELE